MTCQNGSLALFEESKSTSNCSNSVSPSLSLSHTQKKVPTAYHSLCMYVQIFYSMSNLKPGPHVFRGKKEKNLLGIMGFYSYPTHKVMTAGCI